MSINEASMIIPLVSAVIEKLVAHCCAEPRYWQPVKGKYQTMQSLPHSENECQQTMNDFWLFILSNLCGDWLQPSINELLAAFRGQKNRNTLPAPAWE
jgi:hypothetical protein